MATLRPRVCSCCTFSALWEGSTCANTSSMLTSWAMAEAVCRLSPVRRTTLKPISFRALTVARASGLGVSDTASTPASSPSTEQRITVCPSISFLHIRESTNAGTTTEFCFIHSRLPTRTS
uniref:Putative secreted protein n=1 Tax=Ixodes ricinus TaxID=34613 RepID=A0A6B0UN16_IXORI